MLADRSPAPPTDTPPLTYLNRALWVFALVFIAAVAGILTRPLGMLAAFWPANALLLGLFFRRPELASLLGWVAACTAFFAADLLFGEQLLVTLWLSAANLTGVAAGYLLADHFRNRLADLRRPSSVLYLFIISSAAAATAAILGSGTNPVILGSSRMLGLALWFTAELMSYMLILPVALTMPRWYWPLVNRRLSYSAPSAVHCVLRTLPLIALALSLALGMQLAGAAAILVPVPALLWCSLTYRLFTATLLTLLTCMALTIALPNGWAILPNLDNPLLNVVSLRLGILLLALIPLTAAASGALRDDLMLSLNRAVDHDPLTQMLSRRVFMEQAAHTLTAARHGAQPSHLLLIRIEQLKHINALYGQHTGDLVLASVADVLRNYLRPNDLLGRLSGTVFALLLPDLPEPAAHVINQRLNAQIALLSFPAETGPPLQVSASSARRSCAPGAGTTLHKLLIETGQALESRRETVAAGNPAAWAP